MLALAPIWLLLCLLIALAVRLEDGGRVLHRQRRVGRTGREFDLIKFRTMVEGAERHSGPVWAAALDTRVTRVGALLRRFHLDEIPQIVNVVKGEMSLVGPRPERPALVRRIERRLPRFRERLSVRPGIAGLAQARRGYHISPRAKLRYDLVYIETMGPLTDIKLLVACLVKTLRSGKPAAPGRVGAARPGDSGAPRSPSASGERDLSGQLAR